MYWQFPGGAEDTDAIRHDCVSPPGSEPGTFHVQVSILTDKLIDPVTEQLKISGGC